MFCLFEPCRSALTSASRLPLLLRVITVQRTHQRNHSGAIMDLAMAMGLALFGIFTGSTVLFFYRLAR